VLDGDGDAAGALLRAAVDLFERERLAALLRGGDVGERGGERGLAVVDVTDGADVEVLQLRGAHFFLLW
jgi:hypothetical protein